MENVNKCLKDGAVIIKYTPTDRIRYSIVIGGTEKNILFNTVFGLLFK